MLKKICFLLMCLATPSAVLADTLALNPDHPDQYIVQKGDTLWDIAGRFLKQPWHWPKIWRTNPQIEDPHLIYPGDLVSLQFENGQPVLSVNAGDRTGDSDAEAVVSRKLGEREVKLSPAIRSHKKKQAIPPIPIDALQQLLDRPLVVTEEEMSLWPYIVSNYNEHLIASTGNKVYIRGLDENPANKRYAIYRRGDAYINAQKDPETILGYEALYIGHVNITKRGDPASGVVVLTEREILAGDRLVKDDGKTSMRNRFIPHSPLSDIDANVIAIVDGVKQAGQYQIVVVDAGLKEGLEVGHILGIYQSGRIVADKVYTEAKALEQDKKRIVLAHEDKSAFSSAMSSLFNDIRNTKRAFDRTDLVGYLGKPKSSIEEQSVELPPEHIGVLMVFRIFSNLSYALVMQTTDVVRVYDSVKTL